MLSNSTKIVPEGIFNRCISTLLNTKRLPRKTSEATKHTSIPLRFMSVTAFAKCPHKSIKISKEKLFIATKRTSKMLRISSVAGIRQMPAGTQKQPHTSKLAVAVYYAPLCAYLIAFAYITR